MKEARFYKKINNKQVVCNLCYKNCVIQENKTGDCKVRKNIDGKLYSLVYGYPIAINVDPIEKKPIFNYLKNSFTLSLGTVGCNFDCKFCQNCEISQVINNKIYGEERSVQEITQLAKNNNCKSISYTYTEPTIFAEYALDIAKVAKKEGLKNIWVTNGYMQKEVLKEITKYVDAVNIDLKGDQEFYTKLVGNIDINKINENIKYMHEKRLHVEITNLLIEGHNTKKEQIEKLIEFIKSIDNKIPIHFTRSHGYYKLKDIEPTKLSTLKLAEKIAKDKGLDYVYLGNI